MQSIVSVLPLQAARPPACVPYTRRSLEDRLFEAQHGPIRRSAEISRRAVGPQGPLYKRGSQVGVSWNRRWVTLTRSDLTYSYGPVGGTFAGASDPFVCLPNLCLAPQHPACRVSSREQCTVQRARSYWPLPWQNKQIIDSIHVPEIVIVNNAASGNG